MKSLKLKPLLFAAMLAASGSVLADDYTAPQAALFGGPTNYSTWFGATHSEAGAFTDSYTFTYSGAAGFASGLFGNLTTPNGSIDFTSATLNGTTLPTLNWGPVSASYFSLVPVDGLLTLIVSGNTSGTIASYAGTLDVITAAVPEPATYGMMLGGLALMGFVARRRRQV